MPRVLDILLISIIGSWQLKNILNIEANINRARYEERVNVICPNASPAATAKTFCFFFSSNSQTGGFFPSSTDGAVRIYSNHLMPRPGFKLMPVELHRHFEGHNTN